MIQGHTYDTGTYITYNMYVIQGHTQHVCMLYVWSSHIAYAIGSVPSLSGHAIAYRWRSLPRVRRHRASKPQGSSERVLPWQITMDQLIFVSLSRTHYCYEVGMLKVPAIYCSLKRLSNRVQLQYVQTPRFLGF